MFTFPTLTQDQIETFKNDGFVAAKGAFGPDVVARLDAWAKEMTERPEESGKHWVYWEANKKKPDEQIICRIEKISEFHPGFADLAECLKQPVAQLLGEPAVLFKEKINFKYPGADGFKPHQDSQAGWDKYADFFISVLVCIDRATIENGCLQMVAGHHQRGLFTSWEPLTDEQMEGMVWEPYPTEPGDVLFFDCYAPHGSEPNLSDSTRRIYFATYNAESAGNHRDAYYADKHANYPPDIDRETNKEYRFKV